MTFDIIIYISEFINDDDFICSFSRLFNHNQLKKRRKCINSIKSSKLLYNKLNKILHMNYVEYECRIIKEMLINEHIFFNEIIEDFIALFLNIHKIKIYKKHFIKMKHILSNSNNKICNIPVCYIYRVPYSKKKYILENTPYAKALIY